MEKQELESTEQNGNLDDEGIEAQNRNCTETQHDKGHKSDEKFLVPRVSGRTRKLPKKFDSYYL